MSVQSFASLTSMSAPIVAILFFVALALLAFRASIAALGFTLKSSALRRLDLSIAVSLVVLAVCVFARFKLIG
jgi:hypothetical protein